MSDGRLEADPLFLGLTRPPMVFGVTYLWFLVNALIWILYFINTSDFVRLLPGSIITHFVGYFICLKEPRYFELIMTKSSKCMKCRNTMFHSFTQSFDPY